VCAVYVEVSCKRPPSLSQLLRNEGKTNSGSFLRFEATCGTPALFPNPHVKKCNYCGSKPEREGPFVYAPPRTLCLSRGAERGHVLRTAWALCLGGREAGGGNEVILCHLPSAGGSTVHRPHPGGQCSCSLVSPSKEATIDQHLGREVVCTLCSLLARVRGIPVILSSLHVHVVVCERADYKFCDKRAPIPIPQVVLATFERWGFRSEGFHWSGGRGSTQAEEYV